ncbi:MAG: histidinol dehydrogenase, partial [Candidatus Puniceispirillales bacterium]
MAKWLKQGKSEVEIQEADSKVRSTVEQILSDVSKRGDDAVRELSKKFDNYEPKNFILS